MCSTGVVSGLQEYTARTGSRRSEDRRMRMETQLELSQKLQEAVSQIRSLKRFEQETGMSCKKSLGELMARLNADELVTVSRALYGKQ